MILTAWIRVGQFSDAFCPPKPIPLDVKFETVDRMEQLFTELDAPLEQMVTPCVLSRP